MILAALILAAAAPPPPAVDTGVAPAKETLICRRESVTGSLIRARKTCFTRAEWDKIAESARRNATQLQDDNAGRPHCDDNGCGLSGQ